jgi:hypothetical protein
MLDRKQDKKRSRGEWPPSEIISSRAFNGAESRIGMERVAEALLAPAFSIKSVIKSKIRKVTAHL